VSVSGYAQAGIRGIRWLPQVRALTRIDFIRRAGGFAAALLAGGVAVESADAATSPPTGLTALSLDKKVVLSWLSVSGATYTVYRGTTSNPNATQLASGLTSPTYADTTVTNGSTYVYTVRATASGSQSGNSNLAQATPMARGTSSGNAIVLENSFPGSTAWKLTGAAQPPTGLEGFATATSVNAGGSVQLKVNTADGAPYQIQIYRVGYYGGSQARLVSVLPSLVGSSQPDPQTDDNTGLIDCSGWDVAATLTTTSDWPTGIYLLRLLRTDNGSDNHILLVVRNDSVPADLGYALSVTTYQAYNDWGGKSLYTFNSEGDNTVATTPRAVKVSFDRPYNQSLDQQVNFFTECDIQNVSWLEGEGYNLSYLTNIDVHTGSPLSRFKAIISPAHDEYWSAEMRTAFTAARDSGRGLAFFGANAIFWKIRFEANPYSGTANRIQVCYKTIESGGPDPTGVPTTTWRDPTVGQPENALIGQMYIGDNGSNFFPLAVTGAQAQNRFWRYTALTTLAPTQVNNIGQYLLGWEWDARVANGQEPAGVNTVAASPVNGEILTDAGHTYNPSANATSNTTTYHAASGAWVFASGTNQWSRGLGVNMEGDGEPNNFIQQATVNMLADLGARPTTPTAGIVLDKLGPPVVSSTSPASGTTVPGAAGITATFDRALDPSTVNAQTFSMTGPNGAVAATVTYDSGSMTATLTPSGFLDPGDTFTATLSTGINAIDGSPLAATYTWSFTMSSGPFSLFPPTLVPLTTSASVQDGRSGSGPWSYEVGVKIQVEDPQPLTALRFYKDANETGTHVGRVWNSSGTQLAKVTFANESALGWQEQQLATPVTLQPGQTYVVSVNANAFFVMTSAGLQQRVLAGPLQSVADGQNGVFGSAAGAFPTQTYNSSNYFVDVVVAGPPAPPPAFTVTQTSPAANDPAAGATAIVTGTFSVPLNQSSLTAQTFSVTGPGNTAVAGIISYDSASNSALFTPSQSLQAGASYTATLGAGITASDGRQLGQAVTWTFGVTTGSTLFTSAQAPSLVHLAVADGRGGAGPFSYELGVKVQVDTQAQLTAIKFYKDSQETGTHVGRVWSSGGTQLAQVTFANESASGWQQQSLSSPLQLTPGTVYVVSVNSNAFFVETPAGLQAQITSEPLSSVADGQNGVFGMSAGSFPNSSYNSSNYFVDALVV
jgi:N,N-dimethylformamidase beta subunit-like, C-terminal/Domain of unknown function (DUF4082)/Bacterial Ig-like domain